MHIEFLPPPKEGSLRQYLTELSQKLQLLSNTLAGLSQGLEKEEENHGKSSKFYPLG